MRNQQIISSRDPLIRKILSRTFPRYAKPDVTVCEFTGHHPVNSYWDGGTKEEFCLVNLQTFERWSMPTSHPYFDRLPSGERCGNLELSELPPDCALVSGGYFRGKPAHVRINVRPENLQQMLPAPDTDAEPMTDLHSALSSVASCKGGQHRRDQWHRLGLPGDYSATHPLILDLQARGLVKINRAGAVSATTEGRNVNMNNRGY